MSYLHQRLKFRKGKQKDLLKKYMKFKQCFSQQDLARILSVKRSTLKNWINERLTLPNIIFEKICSEFQEANEFKSFINQYLPINWGSKKGGFIRKDQIKDINKYYCKLRIKREKKRQKCHRLLKEKKKINNKIISNLISEGVDLNCFLATYILTDGSLLNKNGNYRISLYTKDETLKDISYNLLLKQGKFIPSIFKTKKEIYHIRISDNYLAKKLLKVSPSYNKKPSKDQSIKKYLEETLPSLEFLKKTNKKTVEWCVRLAFSTDGYISLSKNKTCTVGLTCYHPFLCKEWVEILKLCDLSAYTIKRKNSWCEICEVRLTKESILLFWKMGGFIEGVKISKKSKKYKGWIKNKLLEKAIKTHYGPVA